MPRLAHRTKGECPRSALFARQPLLTRSTVRKARVAQAGRTISHVCVNFWDNGSLPGNAGRS